MALRDYGLSLGTAFQLIDDLLDFTSSEEVLGKAAGADLLGGKVTLPLIYMRDAEPKSREWCRRCCAKGNMAASSKRIFSKPSAAPALSKRPVPALTSTRKRRAPRWITCRIRITATLYAPFPYILDRDR